MYVFCSILLPEDGAEMVTVFTQVLPRLPFNIYKKKQMYKKHCILKDVHNK